MKRLLVHLKDLGIHVGHHDSEPTPQTIRDLNRNLWHVLTCHCKGIGMEMFLPAKYLDDDVTFLSETAWQPKDWMFANLSPDYVKSAVTDWNKDIERDIQKAVADYGQATGTNSKLRAARALELKLHALLTDEVIPDRERFVVRGLDTGLGAEISPEVWASVQDNPEEWAILTVQ